MVGSTLLHYAVDASLGEGGMGTVYRARDTVLNRTVALKVFKEILDWLDRYLGPVAETAR